MWYKHACLMIQLLSCSFHKFYKYHSSSNDTMYDIHIVISCPIFDARNGHDRLRTYWCFMKYVMEILCIYRTYLTHVLPAAVTGMLPKYSMPRPWSMYVGGNSKPVHGKMALCIWHSIPKTEPMSVDDFNWFVLADNWPQWNYSAMDIWCFQNDWWWQHI